MYHLQYFAVITKDRILFQAKQNESYQHTQYHFTSFSKTSDLYSLFISGIIWNNKNNIISK